MQFTSSTIQIRDIEESDINFILSTWLLGLYHGCEWFSRIEKKVFFDNYKKIVTQRIMNGNVKVAVLAEDPDVILGYIVYRENVLDWIFVKKAFRKLGIAKILIPKSINTVTHLTKVGRSLKPKDWSFNPFI